MIVADIRTTAVRVPWVEAPRFVRDYGLPRELLIVEVETRSGVVGMGYLQPLGGGLATLQACVHEVIAPRVLGRDATAVEAIWNDVWKATATMGRAGVTVMAQSAVDIALWDALGKHAGLPLYRLWGGEARDVPAYGSGCWRGLGGEGMVEKARRYAEAGFTAIKMQAGHMWSLNEDIAHVRQMRDALGDAVDIMIDINCGWTADTAIAMGRRFEEFGLYWMEEPVRPDDFAGYRRIADTLDLRVVGGENHFGRHDLRPFFENPNIPILQPDPMRGGFTELRRVAAVADTWGMTIAPHCFDELMGHFMCAIPNPHMLEYMGWLEDLLVDPVPLRDGTMRPPDRPGHGLAFKPEVLRDFAANPPS
ncbi:MAG: mandelate racemase/muconate lactonizing enzyme family protein [Alphaproteobacteria bacterium]